MNAARIRLGRPGEDRPGRSLSPAGNIGIGADLDDDARQRLIDIADTMPAPHLERPTYHIDPQAGNPQLTHHSIPNHTTIGAGRRPPIKTLSPRRGTLQLLVGLRELA